MLKEDTEDKQEQPEGKGEAGIKTYCCVTFIDITPVILDLDEAGDKDSKEAIRDRRDA